MKYMLLTVLCLVSVHLKSQGDQDLAMTEAGDTRLIIGIVIAVVVIILMYILLRKDDK